MIEFTGHFDGKNLVLDEPVEMPRDRSLTVSVARSKRKNRRGCANVFIKIAKLAVDGLPPDLARNHDHYLYGAPKGIED